MKTIKIITLFKSYQCPNIWVQAPICHMYRNVRSCDTWAGAGNWAPEELDTGPTRFLLKFWHFWGFLDYLRSFFTSFHNKSSFIIRERLKSGSLGFLSVEEELFSQIVTNTKSYWIKLIDPRMRGKGKNFVIALISFLVKITLVDALRNICHLQ